MNHPKPRRVTRVLTTQQRATLQRNRRRIAQELPDLAARDQMRKEASDEPTLSGELRRAIHSSSLSLTDIAAQAGIPPLALDEFLTGERTLRSDVLDRLARSLGLVLTSRG
jgi:predicted transcriptional regulator